ncbi:MAG: sigma-70 family RNA polymerase sigma factor [Phycisphaerae bacterium]|nr:sigma-70 family RNA polymerase sigma factor [Phycisphaerae bacterium]
MIASIHASFSTTRRREAGNTTSARDVSRRNALIEEHMSMVPKVVAKTIGRGACRREMDEYVSAGNLGLVQAARTFDPAVGGNFGVYAYGRIRGAVLDEMRRSCFLPVSAYRRFRKLEAAREELTRRLGRPPGDEELAEEMNLSEEQWRETARTARGARYVADDDMDILPLVAGRAESPEEIARKHEAASRLAEAIRLLPHSYRAVVRLYYFRNRKMKDIGLRMGLTESRISQILARATELLRDQLQSPPRRRIAAA